MDPIKVGDALGVRYVLEGQVRKVGDQVRIGLTLTETNGGSVLRSDKIARPLAELMDLLDERAAKIAATVSGRMDDAGRIGGIKKVGGNGRENPRTRCFSTTKPTWYQPRLKGERHEPVVALYH